MRHETELFLEDIVSQDRKILDFIDGKYSFLNERLPGTTASRCLGPRIPARGLE